VPANQEQEPEQEEEQAEAQPVPPAPEAPDEDAEDDDCDALEDELNKNCEALLAKLKSMAPEVDIEDYYIDGEWDAEALVEDVSLHQQRMDAEKVAAADQPKDPADGKAELDEPSVEESGEEEQKRQEERLREEESERLREEQERLREEEEERLREEEQQRKQEEQKREEEAKAREEELLRLQQEEWLRQEEEEKERLHLEEEQRRQEELRQQELEAAQVRAAQIAQENGEREAAKLEGKLPLLRAAVRDALTGIVRNGYVKADEVAHKDVLKEVRGKEESECLAFLRRFESAVERTRLEGTEAPDLASFLREHSEENAAGDETDDDESMALPPPPAAFLRKNVKSPNLPAKVGEDSEIPLLPPPPASFQVENDNGPGQWQTLSASEDPKSKDKSKDEKTKDKGKDDKKDKGKVKMELKMNRKQRRLKEKQEQQRSDGADDSLLMEQGWSKATDPNSGKQYWYHEKTRETRWDRPELASGEKGATDLKQAKLAEQEEERLLADAGWMVAKDPKSGRKYYYHQDTNETRWDKPEVEKPAPVAAPAQVAVQPLGGGKPNDWFFLDGSGEERGPFPLEVMKDWFHSGTLNSKLKVRNGAQGSYVQATKVKGLTGADEADAADAEEEPEPPKEPEPVPTTPVADDDDEAPPPPPPPPVGAVGIQPAQAGGQQVFAALPGMMQFQPQNPQQQMMLQQMMQQQMMQQQMMQQQMMMQQQQHGFPQQQNVFASPQQQQGQSIFHSSTRN